MSIFSNKPKVAPVTSPASSPAGDDAGSAGVAAGTAPAGQSPVEKTDQQWREELTPEEYRVLRQAGTERPYTGEYWDTHTEGVYQCRACGTELFTSREKFDSHCGWPSFWAPLADGTVRYIHDRTLGMERIEVRCAACDSHLGHVFEGEGYGTPTDQRYCINSVSLKLVPAAEATASGTDA
ncbi:peptide-methionine (R)-S-oxide reductase MsrB [Arthrobacter sp. C9C5]|uniref:peptide-methionine (R)-S-oxide reductase MsrB n=1 Tax=Arthrobacter sp. C9C5 TaxID=2735267 RepID=UPI00158501C0|nr:peptide-methionine (R)-S-oxide reductase MsrB [Arthrobacter sp. C9C5]